MTGAALDLDAVRAALGGLKPDTDPRLDRPLHEQVAALVEFAIDPKLATRRTIPVAWRDTDVLVCNVLTKLVAEIERLRAENIDLAASSAGWARRIPTLLDEVDRLTAENDELRRTGRQQ